jgi:hypothetical protein
MLCGEDIRLPGRAAKSSAAEAEEDEKPGENEERVGFSWFVNSLSLVVGEALDM